jgi:hypothetical protein
MFGANFPDGSMSPVRQYLVYDTKEMSLAPLINAPMIGVDTLSWGQKGGSVLLSSYLPLDISDPAERRLREHCKYPVEVTLPSRDYRKIKRDDVAVHGLEMPLHVLIEQDVNTPPKIFVSYPKGQQKTLLLDLNPQFGGLEFGVVRTVEWKVDGVQVIGGLYLPPDYVRGRRYPLVIQTHGFDPKEFSMDGLSEWSSAFAARPLAAKGILVLQALAFKSAQGHRRVSNDKKLGATPQQSFAKFSAHAYERAIDNLDRQGLIDRSRVGIVGFSRTACFVAYMLTHSKFRFAAASLVDGISCGYFEEIAIPEEAWDINNINGGAPPFGKGLDLWSKNSPGFSLDRIRAPVRLVALGNRSVLSAWECYAGLSLQKKPVDFVLIPGAIHIGERVSERMLTQRGIVDWFSFWLKGEEDSDPGRVPQYVRWRKLRAELSATSLAVDPP